MAFYAQDGHDLSADIRPYLLDGEEILWAGQPYTTRKYRADRSVSFFMIVWIGFALFWTVTATAVAGPFGIFGIPFLLIGGLVFYRLFVGAGKQYAETVYAVTDRRAVILYPDRRGTGFVEYVFANLHTVSLEDVEGTTGTIRFQTAWLYESGYGRRRVRYNVDHNANITHAFYAIDDVHTVHRLISERIARR